MISFRLIKQDIKVNLISLEYPAFYKSTFLQLLNGSGNSVSHWVFKLSLWGAKRYNTGSTIKPNLNLNHNFVVKNNNTEKKTVCHSMPSMEILQHVTTQIKQYLTMKQDILQTRDCKCGHIKMTNIINIGFTFATQLAYPVIIEISGWQGSLTQQPYELLRQLHYQ